MKAEKQAAEKAVDIMSAVAELLNNLQGDIKPNC
jgi:hypothetical protein